MTMWTPQEVTAMREQLGLDGPGFAKLVGVDQRSVQRWEQGLAHPTGAAEAVLNGIREKLRKDPDTAGEVIKVLVGAAAIGGLAYLLVKLLDSLASTNNRN